MARLLVLPLAAVALAGCTDAHSPRWTSINTRSHLETQMVMIFGSVRADMGGVPIGNGMRLVSQYISICDVRAWSCDLGG